MDVVVADPATAGALLVAGAVLGRVAAMDPVAAAGTQPTQLLDIQVDQLARPGR